MLQFCRHYTSAQSIHNKNIFRSRQVKADPLNYRDAQKVLYEKVKCNASPGDQV